MTISAPQEDDDTHDHHGPTYLQVSGGDHGVSMQISVSKSKGYRGRVRASAKVSGDQEPEWKH
jgi:hypothetical protein